MVSGEDFPLNQSSENDVNGFVFLDCSKEKSLKKKT